MFCMIIRFERYVCLFFGRSVSVTLQVETGQFNAVLPGSRCVKLKIVVVNNCSKLRTSGTTVPTVLPVIWKHQGRVVQSPIKLT